MFTLSYFLLFINLIKSAPVTATKTHNATSVSVFPTLTSKPLPESLSAALSTKYSLSYKTPARKYITACPGTKSKNTSYIRKLRRKSCFVYNPEIKFYVAKCINMNILFD